MIKKIKLFEFRLSRSKQKPSPAIDLLQPMPMPEDIFLRNEIAHKASLTPSDNSDESSCHLQGLDEHVRCKNIQLMKIYIPDGLGPGQRVNIRHPSGKKMMQANIPLRTRWRSSSESPYPYFLVPVEYPNDTHPSIKTGACWSRTNKEQSCLAKPVKKVTFADLSNASDKSCQCAVSMGVYDTSCPLHD